MPVKYQGNAPTQQAPAPPQEPAGWRQLLGTGVRIAGGISPTSAIGGWSGAGTSALAELLAEAAEGSLDWNTTPARMGVEAGLGAIPLAKTISAGRTLVSAGKNALQSGVGDVGRQVAEGKVDPSIIYGNPEAIGQIDPVRTGVNTMLGGGVGAALGHLSHPDSVLANTFRSWWDTIRRRGAAKPPEVYTLGGNNSKGVTTGAGPSPLPRANREVNPRGPVSPPYAEPPTGPKFERVPTGETGTTTGPRQRTLPTSVRSKAKEEEELFDEFQRQLADEIAMADRVHRAGMASARGGLDDVDAAIAAAEEEAARATIQARKAGLERQPPTVTETVKAPGASSTTRWTVPDEDGGNAANRVPVYPRTSDDAMSMAQQTGGFTPSPEALQAVQAGLSAPKNSPNRLMALHLLAGRSLEEAEALATLGKRPAITNEMAARLRQITGGATDEFEEVAAASTFPNRRVADAPGGHLPGGGGRRATDVFPRRVMGGPTEPPVGGGEVDITGFPQRVMGGPMDPPSVSGRPGLGQLPNETIYDLSDENKGLQTLLDWLQLDAAYGRAAQAGEKVSAKELGPILGSAKSNAMRANMPEEPTFIQQLEESARLAGGNRTPGPKDVKGLAEGSGAAWLKDSIDPTKETGRLSSLEALLSAAGAGVGGLTGLAVSEEDERIENAIMGAFAGAGIPFAPGVIKRIYNSIPKELLGTPEGRAQLVRSVYDFIPQAQRANFLTDAVGLPANMWAGPYGAMITGAIEDILSGDQRGWQVLKLGWNPVSFASKKWLDAAPEAAERLRHGDLGSKFDDAVNFDNPINQLTSLPGLGMTMGDVAARRIFQDAGYSLEEAMKRTMTGEPGTKLGRDVANFGKGSTLASILLPFKRTPANIMEQGTQRLPFGIGMGAHFLQGSGATLREQGIQQLMSLPMTMGGYAAGQNIEDPKQASNARRVMSNLAGRYSLPVSLGFLAGQTLGQDKKLNNRNLEQAFETVFPLPNVDTPVNWAAYLAGKVGMAQERSLPRGTIPFQRQLLDDEKEPVVSQYTGRLRYR